MGGNGLHTNADGEVLRKSEVARLASAGAALVCGVAAIIFWITSALGDKASTTQFEALAQRQTAAEQRQAASELDRAARDARRDERLAWVTSAVFALTQRAGVAVPPPPGGTP